MHTLAVGDRVYKWKGYRWPGEVVGVFKTLTDEPRIVVECTAPAAAGALHIYNPEQLTRLMTLDEADQAVRVERLRQIAKEGWTEHHDDMHNGDGQLLRAAEAYYLNFVTPVELHALPGGWPWQRRWWKPVDPAHDLVIAGALCVAEEDRLVRRRLHVPMHLYVLYNNIVFALMNGRPVL